MAPERKGILVVANPASGRGRAERAANELVAGLRERGETVELYLTGARGDAQTHVREAGGGAKQVVAVGGDGTLREVLEGLPDADLPVGLLPFGTANVVARELRLPRDVPGCLASLGSGRIQPVDVARVNGKLSVLVIGVGFDAMVVQEVERRRSGPITKLRYVDAVLRSLSRYRPPRLAVTLDGGTEEGCGLVLISNLRGYGGILSLARPEESTLDDGLLDVYLFPRASRTELALSFLRGLVTTLHGGAVRMRQARHVRVESRAPVPYQVDGDLGGTTPVEIEVGPNRVRLIVP